MTDLSLLPLTDLPQRAASVSDTVTAAASLEWQPAEAGGRSGSCATPSTTTGRRNPGAEKTALHSVLVLAALLALAACSTGPATLPRPDGQVFRLNPDRWPETVNDIPSAPARTAAR
jgi:hypothetical protein